MFTTHRTRALCLGALLGVMASLGGCLPPAPLDAARPSDAPATPSLRIADADFDRDPSEVDAASALADLDIAARVFEEAYAGLDGQPRLPAAGAITAARQKLASQARWTPTALAAELRSLFGRPDGHLSFGYGGRSPLRLTALPPGEQPERAGPGPSPRDGSALGPAGAPGVASGAGATDTAAVRFTDGPVPVVAIRTFDSAAQRELAELPAIARRLRHKSAFVVDVRGNGGGNYAFAEAFLLELTDRTLKRLDEREVRSVAAAEGRANSARRRLAAGEVPAEARRMFDAHIGRLEAEARALRAASASRTEIAIRGATVRGHAPGPLAGRAIFLVDRGCASACEMMLALARQIPGVILAGENTHGGMAVGEVALFRLPSSGVIISLGTRAFHDPLGDFVEARGFVPDVWLRGPDPLTAALHLAGTGNRGALAMADSAPDARLP